METPIRIIDSKISRTAYVEYNMRLSEAAKAAQKNTLWVWVAAFLIWIVVTGTFQFLVAHKPFPFLEYILTAVAVFVYFKAPTTLRTRYERVYDQTPAIGAASNLSLTPTHVIADTALAHTELKWAYFIGAVEHQQWLMLHSSNRGFLIIDTHQIQLPATAADVYTLLTQHGIPFGIGKVAQALKLTK